MAHVSHHLFDMCGGRKYWHLVLFTKPAIDNDFDARYKQCIGFCQQNIRGNWFKELREFYFEDPHDAMIFKLACT